MCTATAPTKARQRKPVARSMGFVLDPFDGGLVRLTVGKVSTLYATCAFAVSPSMGRAGFQFAKIDADHMAIETYDLLVDHAGKVSSCDCKGFVAHQHCKHRDALAKLLELRPQPQPAPTPKPTPSPAKKCSADLDFF